MATVQDKDIAIWVCPEGASADVKEFPTGGKEPLAVGCGLHGKPFFKRCPNDSCPHPTYHPSDLDRKFHEPCRAPIPWAAAREETARALMEYDTFNSSLVGRVTPELTAAERQDLITPPSERLPAERVRTPPVTPPPGSMYRSPRDEARAIREAPAARPTRVREKAPPRISGPRNTSSDLEAVQREVDAWRSTQRRSEQVWQAPAPMRVVKKPWWQWTLFGISRTVWIVILGASGSLLAAYVASYFGLFKTPGQ